MKFGEKLDLLKILLILSMMVQVLWPVYVNASEEYASIGRVYCSRDASYDSSKKTFTAGSGKSFDIIIDPKPAGGSLSHLKIYIENNEPKDFSVSTAGTLAKGHLDYWFDNIMMEGSGSADLVIKDKRDGSIVGRFKVQTYSDDSKETSTVAVTGIKLAQKSMEIVAGQSASLKVEVIPSNATEKRHSWSVDKDGIIDLNNNGKVTGKTPGVVKVTVISLDGQFKDVCTITVKKATKESLSSKPAETDSPKKNTSPGETKKTDPQTTNQEKAEILPDIDLEKSAEEIKGFLEDIKEKAGEIKIDGFMEKLREHEAGLMEERLESLMNPEDVIRKKAGMEIFSESIKLDEDDILQRNEKAEKTVERLKKIAEKNELQIDETEDVNGVVQLEEKYGEELSSAGNALIYKFKTKEADKFIDKVFDKTIGRLVKLLEKKKLMPGFVKTGVSLFSRFVKDTKDELILTDDEQIQKVKEEIGVKDDVSAELYLKNNSWSDKDTAVGTFQDLLTLNKQAQRFNKVLEQVVSLRKKDYANASKLEYELINGEINRLRVNGISKDKAVEQIKDRYVNEYFEHYGLETKKSDGTWQDKLLQFMGLGGENRRFGGFNRDKMDTSSSDKYKDTAVRFDMIIETMESHMDIYSDDEVEFIRNLRKEEGRD